MENKYLKGNEGLKNAVTAASAAGFTEESVDRLITVLQQRMGEDGHLLLPIELPDENDPNNYRLRGLPGEEGDLFLACSQ